VVTSVVGITVVAKVLGTVVGTVVVALVVGTVVGVVVGVDIGTAGAVLAVLLTNVRLYFESLSTVPTDRVYAESG
jgi:hypothetical protein